MSKELAEAVKLFISQPLNFPLTRGQIMEVARIALPILEQQERGDGWIEWGGLGGCPVEDDVSVVEVKWRGGSTSKIIPGDCSWLHYGGYYDIIAYRIIPEQPTNQNGDGLK